MPSLLCLCCRCAWFEPGAHSEQELKKQTFLSQGSQFKWPMTAIMLGQSVMSFPLPTLPWQRPWQSCNLGARRLPACYLHFSQWSLFLPNCPIYSFCSLLKAWRSKQKWFCSRKLQGIGMKSTRCGIPQSTLFLCLNKSWVFVGFHSPESSLFSWFIRQTVFTVPSIKMERTLQFLTPSSICLWATGPTWS